MTPSGRWQFSHTFWRTTQFLSGVGICLSVALLLMQIELAMTAPVAQNFLSLGNTLLLWSSGLGFAKSAQSRRAC